MVVLEARDRVGGRTLNHPVGDGEVVEVGGQWVGPGPGPAHGARQGAGHPARSRPTPRAPRSSTTSAQQTHFSGLIPPLPAPDAADFDTLLAKIVAADSRRSRSTSRGRRPTPLALDGQTLETWKLANSSTPGARFLFDLATEAVFAAEPRDLSLLHALFYYHSGNGIINLTSTAGGAQDSRFVGGSQLVSIRMARAPGQAGGPQRARAAHRSRRRAGSP